MREITFRGKSLSDGRWLYGDLFRTDLDGEVAIQFYDEEDGWMTAIVRPETVGQFTGEKDINGVDIYEGDIVDCDLAVLTPYNDPDEMQHIRCKVVWERFEFRFAEEKNKYLSQWNGDLDNFKVIGNIYDNPELMKGDKICIQ